MNMARGEWGIHCVRSHDKQFSLVVVNVSTTLQMVVEARVFKVNVFKTLAR